MKVSYDAKTDLTSIRLENVECHLENVLNGVAIIVAGEDDRIAGGV